MVIVGMAAAFACSLSALAEPLQTEDYTSVVVRPDYVYLDNNNLTYTFHAYVSGQFSRMEWFYYNGLTNDWRSFGVTSSTFTWTMTPETVRTKIRVRVTTNNGFIWSNEVIAYNLEHIDSFDSNVVYRFFLSLGTEFLPWLLSSMTTVLGWCLEHPVVFIGLVLTLIIAAIGTLRNIVGGSHEEKASCDINCSY